MGKGLASLILYPCKGVTMPKTKIGKDSLTNLDIKNAKAKEKTYKLPDGGGLFLIVERTGKKWWKLRTVFAGNENSFSLGGYPNVTLAMARDQRDKIRKKIAERIDPSVFRKEEKAKASGENTFESFTKVWLEKFKSKWSESHYSGIQARLSRYVYRSIGKRPMDALTTPELLTVLERIARHSPETARKTMQTLNMVFRYAVVSGLIPFNPVDSLRGALPSVRQKHYAAPTEPKDVAPLLRMLNGYSGTFVVTCALRLAPLVFVRPGELRQAEWAGIDFEKAEWRFAATKTNTDHLVPLSRQAVAILKDLHALTGNDRYVFPSARSTSRPMSNNSVNAAMRRMGISTKEELTGHGFRAMARTILDEVLGFRPEIIEHQLAHAVRDPLGRAYNRTKHLSERVVMMQAWADYLEGLTTQKSDALTTGS